MAIVGTRSCCTDLTYCQQSPRYYERHWASYNFSDHFRNMKTKETLSVYISEPDGDLLEFHQLHLMQHMHRYRRYDSQVLTIYKCMWYVRKYGRHNMQNTHIRVHVYVRVVYPCTTHIPWIIQITIFTHYHSLLLLLLQLSPKWMQDIWIGKKRGRRSFVLRQKWNFQQSRIQYCTVDVLLYPYHIDTCTLFVHLWRFPSHTRLLKYVTGWS